ncbi:MAG TPA: helix-turn-helix domain-containing protein [Candidatus Elarobacter sp.]|jgi:AraC family transcriptional regulator|nr:helix-turn-helix domain-containing protein [Candidatus Elarobacter sp.]
MSAHRGRLLSEVRRDEIAVLDIGYEAESVLSEHRHDRAYVSVLVDGTYTELRDGVPRRCLPGTAIVHPPGEVHADYFAAAGRCVNFEFGAALPAEALLRAVAATHPRHEAAVRAALTSAAGEPARRRDAPPWLAIVLRDFAWLEPAGLDRAATLAGLHPTHFARAFRRHAGMTPGAYRRAARVRAASALLLHSASPLSRIAHDCGFTDQSHLTNVFREATGISPRRYRRTFAR